MHPTWRAACSPCSEELPDGGRGDPGGEGVLLTRSTLGSPVRRRPTTTRRRLSGGPEHARRSQASRRASTRKPLHAGPRPRADRFVTLLPNRRGLADQSQSEDRPLRLLGRSVLRPFGSSAPRHFPWPGPRRLLSDPGSRFRLGVVSRVSFLQPLPGPPSFRKPANPGSGAAADSAGQSSACPRMFEERFRRPRRSVSARSAASRPGLQSRRTALRRSPAWAAGRCASCLWKEPVCLLVSGKAIKQMQTHSFSPGVALSHKQRHC